jgi:DNA polymerase-3 subunit delta'
MWQIKGQDKVVDLLKRSLREGRFPHAYLFVGPPHVGKMTLAINLAQALNCDAEEPPCGKCRSCYKIAAGKHADVLVVGPATNEMTIEQIKEMQKAVFLPPYEGKCKVFILDRAERLSDEAANRLLKTLEEPPPRTLLILLTSKENLLLPTITSRCQRVELPPLHHTQVEEALTQHWNMAPERAKFLARLSKGCLGWALLAEQDDALLGERSQRLDTLLALDKPGRGARLSFAGELAAQFSKNRDLVESWIGLWLEWWRDILLLKEGNRESITNIDRESEIVWRAKCYTLRQLLASIRNLQEALGQLNQNANPRLVLEVLMLKMPFINSEKEYDIELIG